jgi:hypothetical protein
MHWESASIASGNPVSIWMKVYFRDRHEQMAYQRHESAITLDGFLDTTNPAYLSCRAAQFVSRLAGNLTGLLSLPRMASNAYLR